MRSILLVAVFSLGACFSKPPFQGPGSGSNDPTALPLIAAGARHACQITGSLELFCWGDNSFKQLGARSETTTGDPAAVGPETGWLTVVAGDDHTCAGKDGTVSCWGRNDSRQSLPEDQSGNPSVAIGKVAIPGDIERIAAGGSMTCAINTSHDAYCWGAINFSGGAVAGVTQLMPGTKFRQIAVTNDHACAIVEDGSAVCWGSNSDEQLGQDKTLLSLPFANPQPITNNHTFVTLAAGFKVTCGITSDKDLFCWGTGASGQIGAEDGEAHTDVQVGSGVRWTRGAFGVNHTCAVGDGSVYCFGDTDDGGLGAGQFAGRPTVGMPVLDNAVDVTAGLGFSCGRQASEVVQCWGSNVAGELGNHEIAEKLIPVKVELAGTPSQIVAGDHHACALVGTDAYCWGFNSDKQLNGSSPMLLHATPIQGPAGPFSQLATGDAHTCGLKTNGASIVCWGSNGKGQLGAPSATISMNPIAAPGGHTWTYVAAGKGVTCAISSSGTSVGDLWCWGDIPGTTPSTAPSLVDPGTSFVWKSIALGNGFGIGVVFSGGQMRLQGFAAGTTKKCPAGLVTGDPIYPPQEIFAGLQPMTDQPIVSAAQGDNAYACMRYKQNPGQPAIACWGAGAGNELGGVSTADVCEGMKHDLPGSGTFDWAASAGGIVAVNGSHSCALGLDQKVYCWGDDDDLQTRISRATDSGTPTALFGSTQWTQIASGLNVMCGIRSGTAEVDCWGRNKYGEAGDGTSYHPTPVLAGVP